MIKPLYYWTLQKAAHPKAGAWLVCISSLESFIFPIPPDVMLAPMALARRDKALYFAFLCTSGAVIGAVIGYAIGYFFFDLFGQHIIAMFGKEDTFVRLQQLFLDYDMLVVFAAALTPIPFKIATITAGFVHSNILTFILASIIGRGLRYGLIGLLIYLFGERIKNFLDTHFMLALSFGGVIFVLGWVALTLV